MQTTSDCSNLLVTKAPAHKPLVQHCTSLCHQLPWATASNLLQPPINLLHIYPLVTRGGLEVPLVHESGPFINNFTATACNWSSNTNFPIETTGCQAVANRSLGLCDWGLTNHTLWWRFGPFFWDWFKSQKYTIRRVYPLILSDGHVEIRVESGPTFNKLINSYTHQPQHYN